MEAKHLISVRAIPLLSLLLVASAVNGQDLTIPQNEFALSFSQEQLELSRGDSGEVEILILKSKTYLNTKAKMGISSSLPKGVSITFSPNKGDFNSSVANISIQADATPGKYLVILNATLNNKTKGMILRLLID